MSEHAKELGNLLDECGMEVTVTGWKVEYERSLKELTALRQENERLLKENEDFRTLNEKQCTSVYMELVDLLGVPPGGSVIERVERLKKERDEMEKHFLEEHAEAVRQFSRADDLQDELTAAQARIRQVEFERDLAIAHDRQPYPTAEAYELACKTRNRVQDELTAAQARIEKLEKALYDKQYRAECDRLISQRLDQALEGEK